MTLSTLSMAVIAVTKAAIYLRLPAELQTNVGMCSCPHCNVPTKLNKPAMWDTLVVPTTEVNKWHRQEHSYTVHMPDGAIEPFKKYVRANNL